MDMKTLIFDFDGTIADCKELHQFAFRNAVKMDNSEVDFNDEDIEGRPTREKIRILQSRGWIIDSKKIEELKIINTHREMNNYIAYDDDLFQLLHELYLIYKLTLASNASRIFLEQCLEIMRIGHFFDKINSATDFPAKPDITMFIDCMKYTNSTPETTTIIEDSEVGIQCARATGANVIEVENVEDTIRKVRKLLL